MIVSVSLNPSVDWALSVPGFAIGATNRVASSREDFSGKGVNVALSAAALGARSRCVGMIRGDGDGFERALRDACVECDFARLKGSLRVNIKLIDPVSGVSTEANQRGEAVGEGDMRLIREAVERNIERGDALALCGSAPPGCPSGIYAEWASIADRVGCACAVDAEGELLSEAILAKPYLVKPNRAELEGLVGGALDTIDRVADAARSIVGRGVGRVLASLAGDGAVLAVKSHAWHAEALKVDVGSTVGAGDAMLAGFLAARESGEAVEDCLRMAMACAAACVEEVGSKPVSPARARELLPKVIIREI